MMRRFAIEPLESRRLLAATGAISGFALLPGGAGFAGLTVQVESVGSGGNLSAMPGVGPMQTASDGSYSFTGLAAGNYEVLISPSSKLAMGTPSPGAAGGSDGSNDIQLALAAGESATDYNFSILGAQTDEISLRMFLATTGTLSHFLTTLHTAPSVQPDGSGSSSYTATYTSGGAGAAIVSSSATITAPDSPTLTSMTVTIENPLDGGNEQLSATTTGTTLTSDFANGVLTVSGVADLATYETVLQSVLYTDNSGTATAGNRTISIVVNDGTDTSPAATTTITVVQGTGPSGYSIAANQSLIGASAASSTGFTFSGAGVGDTYNYSVSSTGGGTAVTGSGGVTSATQDVTGINVSTLSDGTLTYSVTLTSAGETGPAATATATLATTAPSGYAITASPSEIGVSDEDSTGFTFSGAGVGDTYNYSVSSTGGGTAVTGSGTVTSATQAVTAVNVSPLSDGTLTYSVTLTNTAGDVGAAATATATLVTVAPSGYSITANQPVVNATAASSVGFTFAGATPSDTYQYTISSTGGEASVTGSGAVTSASQDITAINVSSLSNGTLSYAVTLTDAAGNEGNNATATATLYTTLPSGYAIAAPAALNATTDADTGFDFIGATVGTTYNYTISSSGGGTAVTGSGSVTSATQEIGGLNLTALGNGTLTYSVTLTDITGNVGVAATATGLLETVAPSGYAITANQTVVNVAHATDTGFTFANTTTGATYDYTVTTSGGSGSISGSGSVTSTTEDVTGVNVSSLADGTLTFSVTLTDAAGNVGTAATATATLDTAVPSGYTISANQTLVNASEDTSAGFTFVGATAGDTYQFTVASSGGGTAVTGSGSVTSATQLINGINVSALPDGTLTYSVKLTTVDGNVGPAATATATLAKTAPSGYTIAAAPAALNATTDVNAGFDFTGATVSTTFNYSISSSGGGTAVTGSGSVTSAAQDITGINVSALNDGTLTYSVTLTNAAGDVGAAATATAALERVAPSGYAIAANQPVVNVADSTNTGFTFTAAGVGDTYDYSVSSSGGGTAVTGSGNVASTTQDVTGVNVSSLSDGTLTFSVTLTDAAGNVGTAVTATATLDTAVPNGYFAAADTLNITQANASSTGLTLSDATVGTTYNYSVSSSGGGTPVTGSGTVTAATQDITGINVSTLPNGTLTYSVTLASSAGNLGAIATATATLDAVAPSGYSITNVPASLNAPAAANTGFDLADATVGTTYSYTISSSGGGTPVTGSGTVTSATQDITGINVSTLPNGTLTYSVTLTNSGGAAGTAATATTTLNTTAPAGYIIVPVPATLNATNDTAAGFDFAGATVGDSYNYTITSSGGSATATGSGSVTSATQDITGINVSTLNNGTLTFSVTLTNSIGNTGAPATATAALTGALPGGYTIKASPSALNATTDTAAGFNLAGALAGDTYAYSITSSGGGTPITGSGSVTAAAQSFTGINVSSLSDGTLTYSITLTTSGGTAGTPATATGVLERTAPSGYSIVADQGLINETESTDTGFVFSGAVTGTTYNYTITSSAGGAAVTGSGSVTSATQEVNFLDVSSLPDGTLTFSVTLTDAADNVGAAATATATLDTTLTVTSTPATTATVGQLYTYTVQTTAGPGDTVTVTPGSSLPAGMTYDAATETFSWTPTADQAGTAQSFSATLTDNVGNSATLGPVFVEVAAANGLTVVAPPADVAIGAPVLVGFNSTAAGAPTFSVSTSSSSDPSGADLTATLMPQTNQVLQIVTSDGEMDFQLFNNDTPNTVSHFVNLVNADTYDTGASFYRIIQDFVDQGGVGGTGATIPVELNQDLRFTSSGLLSMANDGVDGNGSEFFITNPNDTSNGFLDFRYTIFGKLISGDNVRAAIAATPVTTSTQTGEDSQPLNAPKILSMNVTTETDAGVFMLKAASGATGPYTVTVSDGLGDSQSVTINVGSDSFDPPNPWVAPINGTDTITTAANTPVTVTAQGVSADGSPVQVSAQLFLPLIGSTYSQFLVDSSYIGGTNGNPVADSSNPYMTLQQAPSNSGNSNTLTLTPDSGDYGVQVLEVMGFNPVSGTFQLQVGSTTTAAITFDSTNLSATAANIQSALQTAGFGGATVTVDASTVAPNFNFDVTFAASESPISYTAAATALPITFANSATAAATTQELAFTATGAGWDAGSSVDPVYRAFVPVYVDPPAPQIASISAGGQAVSGTTPANNSTVGTELTFNITGAVAGAAVYVYMDGGSVPIASGLVGAGATTAMAFTDGSTTIPAGSHVFTVVQALTTTAYTVYADWTNGAQGLSPGAQYPIASTTLNSPASAGTSLTITMPVAPSGYSISADQSTISASQSTAIGFTLAGATTDTTYNYTITSDGGTGSVTGSGSVTSATQDVTGINVSSLPDGNLTFSVTLTDVFGDVGAPATAVAVLDA